MIKIGSAMMEYADQLERERGISKELILDSLKEAMLAAYRRYAKLPDGEGLLCRLLERTGEIGIFEKKWVVEAFIEPPPEPETDEDAELDELKTDTEASTQSLTAHEATTEEQPAEEFSEEQWNEPSTEEQESVDPLLAHFEDELTPRRAKAAKQTMDATFEADSEEEPAETVDEPESEEGSVAFSEGEEQAEATEEDSGFKIPQLRHQILLKDARKIKADVQIGDWLEIEVTPSEFGRIAAQSAKQVIMQRIREAEKGLILREFEDKKHSVVPGIVQRLEGSNVIVSIGHSEGILPRREQMPGEYYRVGNKLRVFVLELKESGRLPQIILSQGHPQMVREVFELEVPEIEDGLVEIKGIAREAGNRTKVAVHSPDGQVDPQGACIGTRGSRIQAIVNELNNEKIDIIRWSENPAEFIANALAPARILEIRIDGNPELQRALVIVPDDQLSLAIGREGQNVRLAAKLTGYKLDIKSVSQFERLRDRLMMRRQEEIQAADAAEAEQAYGSEEPPYYDDEEAASHYDASQESMNSYEGSQEDDDSASWQEEASTREVESSNEEEPVL